MGQSTVILTCGNSACNKEFAKPRGEYNRSQKLGRKHFCSLKCFAQAKGILNFKDKKGSNIEGLKKGTERDDFSPFRHNLKIIRKSSKERSIEYTVTLEDLKLVWEKQQGICPYTGWELMILPCTTDSERPPLTPRRASVDRKDSSLGYTIDNIQFVAVMANFAKNAFAERELIEFCDEVARFRKLIDETNHSFERFSKDDFGYLTKSDIDFSNKFNLLMGRDEYSPFRQHLRLARRRVRANGRECNITLEYLKELWESQGGRCPYTGWKLDNPSTTNEYNGYDLHPKRASLDRIDSAKGYVPGNVQFVSVIANYGKRDFREEELLEFCKAVAEYNQTR